jgi:glycosyltransferase involved in cell wall biosynthesis
VITRRRVVVATETAYPEVGGGETQARTLTDALIARGFHVTLVTRRSRGDSARREQEPDLDVVRLPPSGPGRWKKWGLTVTALPALYKAARHADAVLVSGFRILGAPAVMATRWRGTPCVLKGDSRGEMSGEFFRAGLAGLNLTPRSFIVRLLVGLRNRLLRRADAFVALSTEMADEFAACAIPRARISTIPNGVDMDRFRPAEQHERLALRQKLGFASARVAVYTGRLVTYKGLPLLLRAWASVRRQGVDAMLVLVGEGGSDMHACEGELRDFVRTNGLDGSIRFAGAVTTVEDYLRAADVFVFPTTDEAFGLSLVEAMACGLPVASTAVGGIRDFLVDGQNGVVVPVNNEEALQGAIRRLIAGGPEVEALGRAARTTVASRFSTPAVADAMVRLIGALGSARIAASAR